MNRRFFTLVELLIVVAILALLASLLLPVLKHAVESGRNIVCGNNQRQIGVAFTNFAETNQNQFPQAVQSGTWSSNLAMSEFNLVDLNPGIPLPASSCSKTLKNNVFACPTMHAKMWSYGGVSSDWHRAGPCITYSGNPGWSDIWQWGKPHNPWRWNQISRSDYPLIIDTGVGGKWFEPGPNFPRNYVTNTYEPWDFDFYYKFQNIYWNPSSAFIYVSFPGFWHGQGGNEYPLGGTANQLCIDGSVRVIDARNSKRYWSQLGPNAYDPATNYFYDRVTSQPLP